MTTSPISTGCLRNRTLSRSIELELMVPLGSNSGIYLMGEYEVQVLDSYGPSRFTCQPSSLCRSQSSSFTRILR